MTAITTKISICVVLGSLSIVAQQTELSLEQAEDLALHNDPNIQAFLERADAFEHLAAASIELPDVQVRLGLMNYPLEHGNFRTEGMTHSVVGVRQSIPPRGLRPALFDKNEYLAKEQDYKSVNHAFKNYAQGATRLVGCALPRTQFGVDQKSQKLFGDLLHLARTLYSTGDGNKSDYCRLNLSNSRLMIVLLKRNKIETTRILHFANSLALIVR